MEGADPQTLFDAFKLAPAIVALLIVIYFQFKQMQKKDEIILKFAEGNQGDIERQSKMVTLLEILVSRRADFRQDEGSSLPPGGRRDRDSEIDP